MFYNGKHEQRFSIRKYSLGAASVLLGAVIVGGVAPSVHADETQLSTVQVAQEDSQAQAATAQPEVKVIASQKDGDITITTSEVTSQELTDAVASVDTFNKANQLSGDQAVKLEQGETQPQVSVGAADADNKAQAQAIKTALDAYQKQVDYLPAAQEKYQRDLDKYKIDKAEYNKRKADYDAYQAELAKNPNGGLAIAEAASPQSGLIYTNEPNAVLSLEGVDQYVTKESMKQHTDGVDISEHFNTDKYLVEGTSDYDMSNFTNENPYGATEDAWFKMKVGDTVTATYDKLENSSYNGEKLSKVVISYTLNSTTNNNNDAIVKLFHDPTKTVFFGAQTSKPGQEDKISMTLHLTFYNMAGKEIDLSDNKSVMGMSSLNHYTDHPSNANIGNHVEAVVVGDNQFIKIPGSSVDNHNGEAYSKNDNQFEDHGAKFNAQNIINGVDYGWDAINEDGTARNKTAYYAAAAMTYKGQPFTISAGGNDVYRPINFWFSVNSIVTVPEDPGQPPVEPKAPSLEAPTVTWHKNLVIKSTTEERPKVPETPSPKTPEPLKPSVKTQSAPQVVKSQILPDTGDDAGYGIAAFGVGIIALTVATTLMASLKRKED